MESTKADLRVAVRAEMWAILILMETDLALLTDLSLVETRAPLILTALVKAGWKVLDLAWKRVVLILKESYSAL